jgi:hypothetical protein
MSGHFTKSQPYHFGLELRVVVAGNNKHHMVSSLLSLPLHVKHLIIEHCYLLNAQRVVLATGDLRVSCRALNQIILAHPLWQEITQSANCEICEFKQIRSPSFNNRTKDPGVHLGTSTKDPAPLGTLYLHHMGLLKSKASYASYLKYYQFEQQTPNVFHIHRICGGLSEMDTVACLIEQEMQFGNTRDFRVGVLVGIITSTT